MRKATCINPLWFLRLANFISGDDIFNPPAWQISGSKSTHQITTLIIMIYYVVLYTIRHIHTPSLLDTTDVAFATQYISDNHCRLRPNQSSMLCTRVIRVCPRTRSSLLRSSATIILLETNATAL
jgi:hypothetical protein